MAIRRLMEESVEIVCACGAPTVYRASDLTIDIGMITTPQCAKCNTRNMVMFVRRGALPLKNHPEVARIAATKAAFQWLVQAGRLKEGVLAEQIPPTYLEGACAWPTAGNEVVVVLPAPVAKAYAEWIVNHPQ